MGRLPHYVVTCQFARLVAVDTSSDLPRLIMRLSRRIRRARAEAFSPYGLSPHQAGAFLAISRHGHHRPEEELRIADLARHLRIAPRSATEVVDALCARGLIARESSATDRRATSLVVTDAGKALHHDVRAASPTPELFAQLTPEEQETLQRLLEKLLDEDET